MVRMPIRIEGIGPPEREGGGWKPKKRKDAADQPVSRSLWRGTRKERRIVNCLWKMMRDLQSQPLSHRASGQSTASSLLDHHR